LLCRVCGYSLLNLTQPRCPECNTPFDVTSYTFEPGQVRFACCHCGQAYEGDGDRGLPAFTRRECDGCRQTIDVSAMRVIPADPAAGGIAAMGAGLPWECEEDGGVFRRWWDTCRLGMFHRREYYCRIRSTGSGLDMRFFLMSMACTIGGLALCLLVLTGVSVGVQHVRGQTISIEVGVAFFAGSLVMGVLVGAPLVLLGLVLVAGLTHVLLRIAGSKHQGYDATLSVFCYATAPSVVLLIPGLGPWLFWIWGLALTVRGITVLHCTTTIRAAIVCGLTTVIVGLPGLFLAGYVSFITAWPILHVMRWGSL
jgi:hypothetical protein